MGKAIDKPQQVTDLPMMHCCCMVWGDRSLHGCQFSVMQVLCCCRAPTTMVKAYFVRPTYLLARCGPICSPDRLLSPVLASVVQALPLAAHHQPCLQIGTLQQIAGMQRYICHQSGTASCTCQLLLCCCEVCWQHTLITCIGYAGRRIGCAIRHRRYNCVGTI